MGFPDLKLRARALITPTSVDRDLQDELAFHIDREARKLMEEGMPGDQARAAAKARFGSTTVVADECRDQRGTAFVENAIRDLRFALRSIRRAPLASFTIIATIAIGLGLVAVLFTLLNAFLFHVDTVPEVGRIYAIERTRLIDGVASPFTRPPYDALRRETGVFTDSYAAVPDVDLQIDGRTMAVTLVTGTFFDVVRVRPVVGRALTAADDESGGNPVVVLSDKGWNRRFGRDPNVLGRTVVVNGAPFQVIGVMPPGFRGLEFNAPDLWAPLAQLAQFRPARRGGEGTAAIEIVGRLKPGVSMESARAQIAAWDSNRQVAATAGAGETIVLQPRRGTVPRPREAVVIFAPLFFAFGLVLMIGCANVANLLLARGVARQREIGIRLSLGASRRRVIRQLLTESWLLALGAAGGGYLISRAALEAMVYAATQSMPTDLGDVNLEMIVPAADWRVALFLIVAAIAATALFALMPALRATSINPVRSLRGGRAEDTRPGRARNVLIAVQVFASTLLLVCAAIFLRSAMASSQFDPGFRTADTVVIDIVNEPKRVAMLQAIASESTITAHAAVRPGMLAWPYHAFAELAGRKTPVAYKFVSPEYFDVFAIAIRQGRTFTAAEASGGHPAVIVSESMARTLWPSGRAVGETIRIEQDLGDGPAPTDEPTLQTRVVTVVGVARDVAGFRITDVKQPDMFLPTSVNAPNTSIAARVNVDPTLARGTLIDHFTRVDPNMGAIVTMRTVAGLETFFLQVAFWVALVLGGLALLLTGSGLFSVLSYLVEQRTREIGVRMALGASSRKVAQLILAQTMRPVLCGLLSGAGLAASLATILLAMPAGAMIGQVVHVTDPVAYGGSLLLIVAGCVLAAWIPATGAARLDPMRTLRRE